MDRSSICQMKVSRQPLKTLATAASLLLLSGSQSNGSEMGPGIVRAADQAVSSQQNLAEHLHEQQMLEQQLKEAQMLEQKLRSQLVNQSNDAQSEGLEDTDYAINSIEEFVDSGQLEQAAKKGAKPIDEISIKHNTVPVSHSKSPKQKSITPTAKKFQQKQLNQVQLGKKTSQKYATQSLINKDTITKKKNKNINKVKVLQNKSHTMTGNNKQNAEQSVQPKSARNAQKKIDKQTAAFNSDPDSLAATQLSADALEYSIQALETSKLVNESLEQPAALKEVQVIDPNEQLVKKTTDQTENNKQLQRLNKAKKQQTKQDITHQNQNKPADLSGQFNNSQLQKAINKSQTNMTEKHQKSQLALKHKSSNSPVGNPKQHLNKVESTKGFETQPQKKEQKPNQEHQKSHDIVASSEQHQVKTSKPTSLSSHVNQKLTKSKQQMAQKSKSVQNQLVNTNKSDSKKQMNSVSLQGLNVTHQQQSGSLSSKKYSEAKKASQSAKKFREKADELKKQKQEMQAKAADLGNLQKREIQHQQSKQHVNLRSQQINETSFSSRNLNSSLNKRISSTKSQSNSKKHQTQVSDIRQQSKIFDIQLTDQRKTQIKERNKVAEEGSKVANGESHDRDMVEVNDILSTLGNDNLLEAMRIQDVKPEKNMISIEDVSQAEQTTEQLQTNNVKASKNDNVLKKSDTKNQKLISDESKQIFQKSTDDPPKATNNSMISLSNLDFSATLKTDGKSQSQNKDSEKSQSSPKDIIKKLTAQAIIHQKQQHDQQNQKSMSSTSQNTNHIISKAQSKQTKPQNMINNTHQIDLQGVALLKQQNSKITNDMSLNSISIKSIDLSANITKDFGEMLATKPQQIADQSIVDKPKSKNLQGSQKESSSKYIKQEQKDVLTSPVELSKKYTGMSSMSPDDLTSALQNSLPTGRIEMAVNLSQQNQQKSLDFRNSYIDSPSAISVDNSDSDTQKDSVVASILAKMKKQPNKLDTMQIKKPIMAELQTQNALLNTSGLNATSNYKAETEKMIPSDSGVKNMNKEYHIVHNQSKVQMTKADMNINKKAASQIKQQNQSNKQQYVDYSKTFSQDSNNEHQQAESLDSLIQNLSFSDESLNDDKPLAKKMEQSVLDLDINIQKNQNKNKLADQKMTMNFDTNKQATNIVNNGLKNQNLNKIKQESMPAIEAPNSISDQQKYASDLDSQISEANLQEISHKQLPASECKSSQKLNQTNSVAQGDYGEDQLKQIGDVNGKFPSKQDFEDPLDIAKIEAEIQEATLNDIKQNVKTTQQRDTHKKTNSKAQLKITKSTFNQPAQNVEASKLSDSQLSRANSTQFSNTKSEKKPKIQNIKSNQAKNQLQQNIQNSDKKALSVIKSDTQGKKYENFEIRRKLAIPKSQQQTKTAVKQQSGLSNSSSLKQAVKQVAKPIDQTIRQQQSLEKQQVQGKPSNNTKLQEHGPQAVLIKKSQPFQDKTINQVPQSPLSSKRSGQKQLHEQSVLLGHQNQLEQHLDLKIANKLKEMGDESAFDLDDQTAQDDQRVDQQIKQIMTQAKQANDEDKKQDNKQDKKEDRKEDKKQDKKQDKKEDKKQDKKEDKNGANKTLSKKTVQFDDGEPLINEKDYYYADDPYFVNQRPPNKKLARRTKTQQKELKYFDEDIMNELTDDELMHRVLNDLHIHDNRSSDRAIEYLNQYMQKDKLALSDLTQKLEQLSKTQSEIKKTQSSIREERVKIKKLLEDLIRKMDKERTTRENKVEKELKQIDKDETDRRNQDYKDSTDQQKVAKEIVEAQYDRQAKLDQINERILELKRKSTLVKHTQRSVKAEQIRVQQEIQITKQRSQEARKAAQKWQERESERISKDKDQLLEKYLKSRSQNEAQLHQLENQVQNRKNQQAIMNKLVQSEQPVMSADDFDSSETGLGLRHPVDRDSYDFPVSNRYKQMKKYREEDFNNDIEDKSQHDSFGSTDLLDKIKELKHIQGTSYDDNLEYDMDTQPAIYDKQSDEIDQSAHPRFVKSRNRFKYMHPKKSSEIIEDSSSLPPFEQDKDQQYDIKEDKKDYFDYGAYGPITANSPHRISHKIDLLKHLRRNSPFSDKVIPEAKNKYKQTNNQIEDSFEKYSAQDQELGDLNKAEISKQKIASISKLDLLMDQVRHLQMKTEEDQVEHAD